MIKDKDRRIVKFRAWNRHLEQMEQFNPYQMFDWLVDLDYAPIMQFTGWTDKNNVEIYEGDVISKAGAIVVWSERLACWAFDFALSNGTPEVPLFYNYPSDLEVLGNVYEHPHLLT